jgi:hypothetical protein
MRSLILRHWLVLPLSFNALAISTNSFADETPMPCMVFGNEL